MASVTPTLDQQRNKTGNSVITASDVKSRDSVLPWDSTEAVVCDLVSWLDALVLVLELTKTSTYGLGFEVVVMVVTARAIKKTDSVSHISVKCLYMSMSFVN